MLRSLHMKLVLIMVLLVISLMTVAGAFLINSVSQFYLKDFYTQMSDLFGNNRVFVRDLKKASQISDPDAAVRSMMEVLEGNIGELGVDGRNRNVFILDGESGQYLDGSNPELGASLEKNSENLLVALNTGETSSKSNITADYMDVAVVFEPYIIYVLDNQSTVRELTGEMFILIIEALGFGLVISVLLSFLLSKTMVIPIQKLTEGAQRMSEGDFSHEILVDSRDEIGVLTDTFNDMAGQLEQTIQAVENERTKLDALFLHMTDGVVAFNRSGQVIHANPAAEEMLERAIPVDGTVDYDALFADIAPMEAVLEAERDCLEGGLEIGEKSLKLLLAPFSREEQAGVLVVIHDVTQQMKTEEMRREFVANVSHELRTPLTNIRSYAETLSDTPDLPKDMQENFLQVILNESDRMTHIVQDLLTLSRFDSGRGELSFTVFSYETVLQELYQAVFLDAQKRGHKLELLIQEPLPDIRADKERIQQVLMNIISNSMKYTPDNGHIVISAGLTDSGIWTEVTDNGIGIPAEDRERIFDRFYRVDKARARESGGTGLGLSIAKEIVNRHEGSLTLVNRSGSGTTVRLELKAEGPDHEE